MKTCVPVSAHTRWNSKKTIEEISKSYDSCKLDHHRLCLGCPHSVVLTRTPVVLINHNSQFGPSVRSSCSICPVRMCINQSFGNKINCLHALQPLSFYVLKIPVGLNGHPSTRTWTCRGTLIYLHIKPHFGVFCTALWSCITSITTKKMGVQVCQVPAFRLLKIHIIMKLFSLYRLIFNFMPTSQQIHILYIYYFSHYSFFSLFSKIIFYRKEVEIKKIVIHGTKLVQKLKKTTPSSLSVWPSVNLTALKKIYFREFSNWYLDKS